MNSNHEAVRERGPSRRAERLAAREEREAQRAELAQLRENPPEAPRWYPGLHATALLLGGIAFGIATLLALTPLFVFAPGTGRSGTGRVEVSQEAVDFATWAGEPFWPLAFWVALLGAWLGLIGRTMHGRTLAVRPALYSLALLPIAASLLLVPHELTSWVLAGVLLLPGLAWFLYLRTDEVTELYLKFMSVEYSPHPWTGKPRRAYRFGAGRKKREK